MGFARLTLQPGTGVCLEVLPVSVVDDRNEVGVELRKRISHRTRALLLVSPGDLAGRLASILGELKPVVVAGKTQQPYRFGIAGLDQLSAGRLLSGWNLFFLVGRLPSGLGAVTKALSRVAFPGRVPVIHFINARRAPP